MIKSFSWVTVLCIAMLGVANAETRDYHRGGPGPRPGWDHVDTRYGRHAYYPSRGVYVRELPRDRVVVTGPRGRFWYSGGAWYSYGPRGYFVVGAPIGFFVPVLPPFYSTV